MIKRTMCIGCGCEGFLFAEMLGTRIKGPVDNISGFNFTSTLDLFTGELYDSIMTDKILSKEIYTGEMPENCEDDDWSLRYYCSKNDVQWNENGMPLKGNWGWRTMHNNFELNNRKIEFKRRYQVFKEFQKTLDNNSYYLYTLSDGDPYLTENEFNNVVNQLPSYVTDKLIIISGIRIPNIPDVFYRNFKCIHYNNDLTGEDRYPNVKWY